MSIQEDVTRHLAEMKAGQPGSAEALFSLLYNELHGRAKYCMARERPEHTLQTTALVNEAFIRLGVDREKTWESQAHFLRIASRAMRHVLIDYAHRKNAKKRGSRRARKVLEEAAACFEESSEDLLALNEALERFSALDPRSAQIVELRFFGGLTIEETAKVLGISTMTVKRDWNTARAWLKKEIAKEL